MDPNIQAILDNANQAQATIDSKTADLAAAQKALADAQAQIAALEAQPRPVTYVLGSLQTVMPEQLWYEARSAGAPRTGPHGTVTITLGEPAVADFHPVVLAGGHSDNVYLLRRLYPFLTDEMKAALDTASEFSVGCETTIDPAASEQAFELDYQARRTDGTVINIGLQLLPDGTLRVFDYVNKDWVPVAKVSISGTMALRLDATCDGQQVQFTQVLANGAATPLSLGHPVSKSTANSPYLNCAYQLDGTKDAKPYKATVGKLTVTFTNK